MQNIKLEEAARAFWDISSRPLSYRIEDASAVADVRPQETPTDGFSGAFFLRQTRESPREPRDSRTKGVI